MTWVERTSNSYCLFRRNRWALSRFYSYLLWCLLMELGPFSLVLSWVPSLWLDSLPGEVDFMEGVDEWSRLSVVECARRS